MANNVNNENENELTAQNANEDEGVEITNQGQNLGGGKDERTIDLGEKGGGDEFSKTDQSIAQAAPGQTATNTTQGGSNA